jgi:putative thiamine transport system substrate-binding protein
VSSGVRKGGFPGSARPFLLGGGALQNTSFVTIPADAAHQAGAQVVANLLLSPRLQAAKLAPDSLGNPTVLDHRRLGASARLFSGVASSPYILGDYGRTVPELPADRVAPLERRWTQEVLR